MKGTIVVIPAFNEARTIREVVAAVRRRDIDRVVVVDDGSTDATATLVQALEAEDDAAPSLELIRHPTNRGKGFALASGIARALACGGQRIVTIDADGQHCADDIPRLEQAAMRAPEAIVIAARTEAREEAPPLRRFANEVADFWISWACGRRVEDTQSGFRLYPSAVLARLSVQPRRNAGFAFETELLIDGVAAGAEIRSVPILTRYLPDRRLSHYRPWRDTWSIIRLVGAKLLRRGLYPTGLLRSLDRGSGSAKGGIDRDEIGTLALTVLVGVAAAGLPFVIAFARVLGVGLRAKTEGGTGVVVVFGKRLVDDRPDRDYRARLETAARLAAVSSGRILILGGRTGRASITEAEAGERILRTLPGGRELSVALEQTSQDTLTNLRNARALVAETESSDPLTLISNRYHLARVGQMASSLGLRYRLCAAEDVATARHLSSLHLWLIEGFYVAWFATGKAWARLTRNRRMVARVT